MFDFQSAEFSTLGALLIDGSCLEQVRPVLPNGEAFGNPACRKAYEAICALADQGKPIDPVTVGRLSGLDNRFLLECMELSPTCVYAGDHAKTVAEGYARRLAAFAPLNCSYSRLLFSKTTQEEELQLLNTCGQLEPRALRLWNPNGLTVPELEQQARHLKAQVVILDYLGLVQTRSTRQTEYERVTQISGDLKRMARRLNCVMLALCQLNRESVSPVCDSLPKLSQLRSSGALEQDADGVLLLHRNAPSDPQDPSQPQPFYINVAKNRHGRTGTVELNWYPPVNRFEDRSGKWPVMSWR